MKFWKRRLSQVQASTLRPLLLSVSLMGSLGVSGQELNWSLGGYAGQYYDSEPAFLIKGEGSFANQYLLALNASKTIWRSQSFPLALEIDAVIAQQFGVASLTEFAIAPTLRWSGFPWNSLVQTSFRFAPFGFSHTTQVSSLEKNAQGEGTHNLSFLVAELALSKPGNKVDEYFIRMHHRSTIYGYLNTYGANGQDFLVLGYRRFF